MTGYAMFNDHLAKMAFLLQMQEKRRVLMIGRPFFGEENAASEFPIDRLTDGRSIGEQLPTRNYGLILWRLEQGDIPALVGNLPLVRRLLAADGSFMLLAGNRFCGSSLRNPYGFVRSRLRGYRGYRKLLSGSGFAQMMNFIPLPALATAEEFLNVDCLGSSSVARMLGGFFSKRESLQFCDGFAFTLADREVGIEATRRLFQHYLTQCVEDQRILIERFHLRARGSLIVVGQGEENRRFVFRVATSAATDATIGRHAHWAGRISAHPDLKAELKKVVPTPLGQFSHGTKRVYIEPFHDGILAWKPAVRGIHRDRIFKECYRFIRDFNGRTANFLMMNDELFRRLVRPEPDGQWRQESKDFRVLCTSLIRYLARSLLGKGRFIVWGHGDFGYGNIIVNPRTAELKGVIDWDTAREVELAGIDLLNLQVQKHRIEEKVCLAKALEKVAASLGRQDESRQMLAYRNRFLITRSQTVELITLCALRFVQRGMRYRDHFRQDREEYLAALEFAINWSRNHDE
jgi:hypothetical protein